MELSNENEFNQRLYTTMYNVLMRAGGAGVTWDTVTMSKTRMTVTQYADDISRDSEVSLDFDACV